MHRSSSESSSESCRTKTIGIVGGIAWPSSIVYYRTINELVAQRRGDDGVHSARLVLAQTDFAEIEHDQRGAEAIVLGCTEFGMLVEAEDSPVPTIDTTVAHARAAVDMALADEAR